MAVAAVQEHHIVSISDGGFQKAREENVNRVRIKLLQANSLMCRSD